MCDAMYPFKNAPPETPVPSPSVIVDEVKSTVGTEPDETPGQAEEVGDQDQEELMGMGDGLETTATERAPPEQLSKGAIYKRLARLATPKANGQLKLPAEVIDEYKDPATRDKVLLLFEKSGYQPDWVGVKS